PRTLAANPPGFSFEVSPPAELALPALGIKFRFQVVENVHDEDPRKTYNENEGFRIDFERIGGSLLLRNWRPGDRFRPWGRRNAHKVKELFQELKVPLEHRRLWPVLSSGDAIVWVRDFPPAADFVASASSRKLLTIREEPLSDVGANTESGI
ncbi:MAG TPA: tRNA lysidine(34) synthetase TilS, partial [Terriglobia bacterium]|nr:tRNA lysidine(34) synthetase TilS [Terriglobia bacterium]